MMRKALWTVMVLEEGVAPAGLLGVGLLNSG